MGLPPLQLKEPAIKRRVVATFSPNEWEAVSGTSNNRDCRYYRQIGFGKVSIIPLIVN